MEEIEGTEEESTDFLEESVVLPMETAEKLEIPCSSKDYFRQIVTATLNALSIQMEDEAPLPANMNEDRATQIQTMILDAIQELQSYQTINLAEKEAKSLSSWIEFAEEHPLATNDISSPVIMNVLSTWTTNSTKKNFFVHWVKSLGSPYDPQIALPLGIQITGVSKILRDAFLVLVLPVLRHISVDPVLTTTREYPGHPCDEVILSTMHEIPASNSSNKDPFVDSSETVYDIRFKRLVSEQIHHRDRHNSEDYVCSSQAHFCLESDDYCPLSEINTGLKDLEKKVRDEMEAYDRERIAKLRADQRANRNSSTIPSTTTTEGATWIDQISSWFVPTSTANTASSASSATGRWSSFSAAPATFSLAEEEEDDDGYDVNRRSTSFSFLPLEARAHVAMSDGNASSWWGSPPASSNAASTSAPKPSKRVNFDLRPVESQDLQSTSSSVASSPEYLPGPLEELEFYKNSVSSQQVTPQQSVASPPSPAQISPAVEISRESAAERAAKNKDKIAARLAALREKQLSGK